MKTNKKKVKKSGSKKTGRKKITRKKDSLKPKKSASKKKTKKSKNLVKKSGSKRIAKKKKSSQAQLQTMSILSEIKKPSKKLSVTSSSLSSTPLSHKPNAPDLDDIIEVSQPSSLEPINPFKVENKNRQKSASSDEVFTYENSDSDLFETETDYEDLDEKNLFDDLDTHYDSQISDEEDDDDENYF